MPVASRIARDCGDDLQCVTNLFIEHSFRKKEIQPGKRRRSPLDYPTVRCFFLGSQVLQNNVVQGSLSVRQIRAGKIDRTGPVDIRQIEDLVRERSAVSKLSRNWIVFDRLGSIDNNQLNSGVGILEIRGE